ncbi:signal peptidase I [Paenibacillus curdlanolyticus YK9]|uniref:Signal peptidase I n=2 Tax=Paenibacillus curdlanolyticus TaxID=59840 RepID=E0I422_9BACL|nr:signal peptidase I [Paenibacillus curdlanolyticus]EFM13036.1 signal peptidase I [Paenibacillus curdlanolyticus YK9]
MEHNRTNDQENMNHATDSDVDKQPVSNSPADHKPAKRSGATKEITEWVKAIGIAVILVLIIRWLLFMPFIVDGPSMQPNFETGERVIVNKVLYKFREPKHGEVVVFFVPEENRNFIKRVIGVPGDKIRYEGDDLYVNDQKVDETYLKEPIAQAHAKGELYNNSAMTPNYPNERFTESVVPEGHIFVLGDNRPNSKDSRMIGFVDMDNVIGRSDVIFWPLNKVRVIGHK